MRRYIQTKCVTCNSPIPLTLDPTPLFLHLGPSLNALIFPLHPAPGDHQAGAHTHKPASRHRAGRPDRHGPTGQGEARRGGRTTKTHIAGQCLGALASIGYVHTIHGLGDGHMCRPAARRVQKARQGRALGGPVSPGGCRSRASWAVGREPRWKDRATTINDATWQARSRGWAPADHQPAPASHPPPRQTCSSKQVLTTRAHSPSPPPSPEIGAASISKYRSLQVPSDPQTAGM
ncbi:hypothetical protein BT67DRAFT_126198 [Trichocladium antarcticum]|uniref:Uncharacterized protein n=1 Tax=Trichocladium antarcticum TaxID=1450529 RepID=A0AAN6ZHD1_9PEZI|nr:hypothetical protein BT67DRAFT_126198 [Trichocladium antarcticum]